MTLGVTGQRPKNQRSVISPNLLPVVGDTAITVETSALNRKDLSGKSEGSMVVVLDGHDKGIYVSTGDTEEAKWMHIPGVSDDELGKGPVRELLDMVDVEFEALDTMLDLTETRIDTRVIETPMRLMDGSYGFRCRMTFNFSFKKKEQYVSRDEFSFVMKLVNAAGSLGEYYIVDHASCIGWSIGGAVIAHVDVFSAKTNNIPVMLRTTSNTSNFYRVSFALEWTSSEPIAEG